MPEMVTVGCKMPNGVVLDLDETITPDHPNAPVRIKKGASVTLKGNRAKFGMPDLTIGGYMFTHVDAAFWAAWLARNKDSSLLADNLIICAPKVSDLERKAVEMADVPAMFAPMKQDAAGVRTLSMKD